MSIMGQIWTTALDSLFKGRASVGSKLRDRGLEVAYRWTFASMRW
jgi:hypothetical protein